MKRFYFENAGLIALFIAFALFLWFIAFPAADAWIWSRCGL